MKLDKETAFNNIIQALRKVNTLNMDTAMLLHRSIQVIMRELEIPQTNTTPSGEMDGGDLSEDS